MGRVVVLYQTVIEKTKKIESILEKKYGAEGRGLHEKCTNVENKIDLKVIKKIRLIATIRNKLIHEDDFKLDDNDLKRFLETCEYVVVQLTDDNRSINERYKYQNSKKDEPIEDGYQNEKDSSDDDFNFLNYLIDNYNNSSKPMKIVKGILGGAAALAAAFFYIKNA